MTTASDVDITAEKLLRRVLTCLFPDCGYQWMSRTEPEKCPHCVRRGWKTGEVLHGRPPKPPPLREKVQLRRALQPATEKVLQEKVAPVKISPTASRSPVVQAKREKLRENVGRNVAKCPHGWMNWLLCETCNPR